MKPSAVQQYPQPLTVAVSDFARAGGRHGVTAYAMSLCLAGTTLVGSVFHKEITHTFGRELFGMRAVTLWEAAFLLVALVWLTAMTLGVLCLPLKGRPRVFGVYSVFINLAAAMLAACTLL